MAKRQILAGSKDQTIDIAVLDSSSTTGGYLTGLAHNTSGLTCYYRKGAKGASTALSLVTQTATGEHADGGFAQIDSTNKPGEYRLDLSDTMVASPGMLTITLRGAANMVEVKIEIEVLTPAEVYVAPHGDNSLNSGVTKDQPLATVTAGATLARNFPGCTLVIYPGRYNGESTNVANLFCKETYRQVATFTESSEVPGGVQATREYLSLAGTGSEGYGASGGVSTSLVGSKIIRTSDSQERTIDSATFVPGGSDDYWLIHVTSAFTGADYAAAIGGETFYINRERVRTGVSVKCLGPVIIEFACVLGSVGPYIAVGEGSIVEGDPHFGLIGKPTASDFQAFIGQHVSFSGMMNGTSFGAANYAIRNVGQRNGSTDVTDGWYDTVSTSTEYHAAQTHGIANCHFRANWDAGRQTGSVKDVYIVDSSFISYGPTSVSGSNNETRNFALSSGSVNAFNTDFISLNGSDYTYGLFVEGGTLTLGPGCRVYAQSSTGTVKYIKATGGTITNATGIAIDSGNRDTTGATYNAASDIETLELSPHARASSNLADVRQVQSRTILTPGADGVLKVDTSYFGGSAGTFSGGRPEVNTTRVGGQTATASATVDFDDLGGSGGTGTGARTVTATVNDGTTTLSSAVIRFTKGAETYSTTTNGSGVATFNLDDGTWTVAITKSGYTFAGTTLVVDGDETATYSMTEVAINPAGDPAQTTGYLTTRNGVGTAKANVTINFRLIEGPGSAGHSYDRKPFTATSNGSGLLEVTLLREATYAAIRGDGNQTQFTTDDASTYQLPENIGYDA